MKYLERMLTEAGYKVMRVLGDNAQVDLSGMATNNVILPVPCERADGSLNTPFSDVKISLAQVIEKLGICKCIFGGMLTPAAYQLCEARGICCFDYMKCEPLTITNAQATAEGAIKVAIENTSFTLCSSRVLVTGYGRIGKLLSRYLKALGADVTVEARKETDLAWIKANGYTPLPLYKLCEYADAFDIIFNTVPYEIFTEREIINLNKNVVYIELASLPGGIDEIAARGRKIKVVKAASLPGKTAPETSACAIRDAILGIIKEAEV